MALHSKAMQQGEKVSQLEACRVLMGKNPPSHWVY